MSNKSNAELNALYPEPETLSTSIGDLTVSRFSIKKLAKCGETIAKFASAITLEDLKATPVKVDINPNMLIYTIFENEMEPVFLLMHLATDKPIETLETLEVPEAFDLLELVIKICIMPVIKKASQSAKKLPKKEGNQAGQTASLVSPSTGSASKKSEK